MATAVLAPIVIGLLYNVIRLIWEQLFLPYLEEEKPKRERYRITHFEDFAEEEKPKRFLLTDDGELMEDFE